MKRGFFFCLVLPVFFTGSLIAQEAGRGPDGGTTYHVAGVELLAIPDKPFSARSRIDWTRTLEDGSATKLHLESNLARDSQGRMYRERRTFVSDGSNEQSKLLEIILFNPILHTRTSCIEATHHCNITSYHAQTSFAVMPVGPFAKGTRYLARESIGTNTIDGLDVIGTRETTTINPGVVGNERPLVSTREFWYSSELETNLAVTRKDPREGTQVIQLSDISRSEPGPEKFQVPAGFVVQDDRVAPQAQN